MTIRLLRVLEANRLAGCCNARIPFCVPFYAVAVAAATGAALPSLATTAGVFDGVKLVFFDADVDIAPSTVVANAAVAE